MTSQEITSEPRHKAGISRLTRREGRTGYVLIAPATILLTLFYLYPLVMTIFYSLTNWNSGTGQLGGFAGVSNYKALVTNHDFLQSLGNTAIYVIVVVPVTLALGMIFAVMLARPFHGRSVYRALLFTPYIASAVGSALIFSYILSPLGGVINGALGALGLGPISFTAASPWALITVIGFSIWQGVGYSMIIYSAALSGIPTSYYEAATLDGAGSLRRFFSISLPLLKPTTGFLAVTGVIGALQVFAQVYMLTQGGPLGSSTTVLYWIYQQGFTFFHGGYASAGAVVLLIIGIVTAAVQMKYFNRDEPVEMM